MAIASQIEPSYVARRWTRWVVVIVIVALGATFFCGAVMPYSTTSPVAFIAVAVEPESTPKTTPQPQQSPLQDSSISQVRVETVQWTPLTRNPQRSRKFNAARFVNSDRMRWAGTSCDPNSRYADSDDDGRRVFRDIIAFSDLQEMHDAAGCFYFDRGVWNQTLDVAQFHRDVLAVRSGAAKAEWTCTMEQLSRQASLRMAFTRSDDATSRQAKSEYGGRPRQVRFGQLQHGDCRLVDLADPYSLLVALSTLRGGRVSTNHTVIEVLGDSLHRGMFATIIAMLRGVGERAYFDRQAHSTVKYFVTAHGDHFATDDANAPPIDRRLLEVRFHPTFHYPMGAFPTQLRLDNEVAPTVVVTGGLDHVEWDCKSRFDRMGPLQQLTNLIDSHISAAQHNRLEELNRFVLMANVSEVHEPRSFSLPAQEALVIMKSGVRRAVWENGALLGYHSIRNFLYRDVVDKANARVEVLSQQVDVPRHLRHRVVNYLRASPGVLFLDENHLLDFAEEGPAALPNVPIELKEVLPSTGVATSRGATATSLLEPEIMPSDDLHAACVMHRVLPNRVGDWRLPYSSCRGWRERANVQIVASMMLATARQRHDAERQWMSH